MKLLRHKHSLAGLILGILYLNMAIADEDIVECRTKTNDFLLRVSSYSAVNKVIGVTQYISGGEVRTILLKLEQVILEASEKDNKVYAKKIIGHKDISVKDEDMHRSMLSDKTIQGTLFANWELRLNLNSSDRVNGMLVVNEKGTTKDESVVIDLYLICKIHPLSSNLIQYMADQQVLNVTTNKYRSSIEVKKEQEERRARELYPDMLLDVALQRMRNNQKKAQETAGWTDSSLQKQGEQVILPNTHDINMSKGKQEADTKTE